MSTTCEPDRVRDGMVGFFGSYRTIIFLRPPARLYVSGCISPLVAVGADEGDSEAGQRGDGGGGAVVA